jgi:hypothetical protein
MSSLFKIFQTLQSQSPTNSEGFIIASLPFLENHKIGVSENGQPMFFIKCSNETKAKSLDTSLEFISVQFNRECQLIASDKNITTGIYTIILLNADSIDLQEYFIDVVSIVIKKLRDLPSLKELQTEIARLIDLFSKFSKPPSKTIQGLWSELFVIEQSKHPDYLINSWHNSSDDKFDFNDGIDKVEVKSTSKSRRVHSFSIEQLHPSANSKLIIVSVFTIETGMGKSIFDLVDSIGKRITDLNLLTRINTIIAQTIGKDFEKAFNIFFDYQHAIDTVGFYEAESIPSIKISSVPIGVLNVRFDSDLTDIQAIKINKCVPILHKSL